MEKLIITVAPPGRANFPSPPDMRDAKVQAQAVVDAYNAGASIGHVHGNRLSSPPETREYDIDHWAELTSLIRARCDIVVEFGASIVPEAVRKPLLVLKPEIGILLLGHHDMVGQGGHIQFLFPLEDQKERARNHLAAGVLARGEIWHSGNVWNMKQLIEAGLLQPPHFCSLVFGKQGGHWAPPTPEKLLSRLAVLPPETEWCVSVRGPEHFTMLALAITLGGHVQTGFEDHADMAPGRPAQSNAEMVEHVVRLARDLGREVATPQEVREILHLPRPVRTASPEAQAARA